jgi:hypothetical protein
MGFWDFDGISVVSKKSHGKHGGSTHKLVRRKSRSHSRSRSRSRSSSRHRHQSLGGSVAASIFGGDSHHHKHNSSRASFFGLGNASRSSFFGFSESCTDFPSVSKIGTEDGEAMKKGEGREIAGMKTG